MIVYESQFKRINKEGTDMSGVSATVSVTISGGGTDVKECVPIHKYSHTNKHTRAPTHKTHSRSSHRTPVTLGGQVQMTDPPSIWHVPPPRHRFSSQSVISA